MSRRGLKIHTPSWCCTCYHPAIVHVCVCACVHFVRALSRVFVCCIRRHLEVRMHVCMYARMYVCMFKRWCVPAFDVTCNFERVRVCTYVCMYARTLAYVLRTGIVDCFLF